MSLLYLGVLLFSFFGMLVLDQRKRLAWFVDARRTALTLAAGVAVFCMWDALGIGLGVFFSGESAYMSGWYLAPEFPVEELVFLTFLCYFTLIIYRLLEARWRHT